MFNEILNTNVINSPSPYSIPYYIYIVYTLHNIYHRVVRYVLIFIKNEIIIYIIKEVFLYLYRKLFIQIGPLTTNIKLIII